MQKNKTLNTKKLSGRFCSFFEEEFFNTTQSAENRYDAELFHMVCKNRIHFYPLIHVENSGL